jgi:cyclic pyranopterin phosphate synthase
MPEDGIVCQAREELLTFEEIERLVRFFVERGVRKVRLTGGEPSVRKEYLTLVDRLSKVSGLESLAMTTNGSRLAKDAVALKMAGLNILNVSLDTLRPGRFTEITRRSDFSNVLAGIEAALKAGIETKINVVVLPDLNDDEVLAFVEFAKRQTITVRFIEFMPFLDNGWHPSRVISSAELRERISACYRLQAISGNASDVAREYSIDGGESRVAFVSSVTESFCQGCSRLRLTADGQLKSCLFLPASVSLRDLIRANVDEERLEGAVRTCLDGKWKAHPPMRDWAQRDHLTMVQIGG